MFTEIDNERKGKENAKITEAFHANITGTSANLI
jgi:hypothetical protein